MIKTITVSHNINEILKRKKPNKQKQQMVYSDLRPVLFLYLGSDPSLCRQLVPGSACILLLSNYVAQEHVSAWL